MVLRKNWGMDKPEIAYGVKFLIYNSGGRYTYMMKRTTFDFFESEIVL